MIRYDWVGDDDGMQPVADGEWVTYDDASDEMEDHAKQIAEQLAELEHVSAMLDEAQIRIGELERALRNIIIEADI